MSFLKAQVSFPSNVVSIFSTIKQNSPILFFAQTLYALLKRSPLKWKFLRFSSAGVKIRQIPHVNFELTNQFLSNFCIIFHCHSKFVKFFMSVLNWQISSSSIFASFFIVITQNFPVNFKLIHFLHWIKGYHQNSHF